MLKNNTKKLKPNTLKVVMFSGGRGTSQLSESFLNHGQIDLSLIINAYDDGKSTGEIRKLIPGILGPSDFRKNISNFMPKDKASQGMRRIIDWRLPVKLNFDKGVEVLEKISKGKIEELISLNSYFDWISVKDFAFVKEKISLFLTYCLIRKEEKFIFDFSDCCFGNLLFAGCYISNQEDFNKTIDELNKEWCCLINIVNIDKGENKVLTAIKSKGLFMENEEQIVSEQSKECIKDIFLYDEYLSKSDIQKLGNLNKISKKVAFLQSFEKLPEISINARELLLNADLIIYGPGTQHSSLFPSYLTRGVAEAIISNKEAEKIYISNVNKDHDIQYETSNTLVDKLFYYLSRKNEVEIEWKDLVTSFFVQISDQENSFLDEKNKFKYFLKSNKFFSDTQDENNLEHDGSKFVVAIMEIVNDMLQKREDLLERS